MWGVLTPKPRRAKSYETNDGKRPFESWVTKLKDVVGKAKILARVERAEGGNFGQYRDLGRGLYEMKQDLLV